ncbi:MAG: WcaI family glycosyltransferase [Alphaproteobacteria bacterium]|nr:WcaI family glycosyltransferase [Alphaproteobacteria bacterium]
MRILIHGLNFAPEPTGIGRFTGDMAAWLAARGHRVGVVTAPPYYPAWRVGDGYSAWRWSRETWRGVRVIRCPLYVPSRATGLRRLAHLASFAASSSLIVCWRTAFSEPDIVFAVAPALVGAPASWFAARLGGALAWLHVQDFETDAAFGLGLLPAGAGAAARRAEGLLLRGFDVVSSISPGMVDRLADKGVAAGRTVLFPNWVDVTVQDVAARGERYRRELGIPDDAVVALYAGNIGAKQGAETMAEAAAVLRDSPRPDGPDIRFVVCAAGAGLSALEAAVGRHALAPETFRLLPLQPEERLADLLASADIHLLPQRASAADLVMPSKLGGMLASGRPTVAGADPGTQIARTVEGCGLVVPPGDAGAMADAVFRLAREPALRHKLGMTARAAAEATYDRETVLGRLEEDFASRLAAKRESRK